MTREREREQRSIKSWRRVQHLLGLEDNHNTPEHCTIPCVEDLVHHENNNNNRKIVNMSKMTSSGVMLNG